MIPRLRYVWFFRISTLLLSAWLALHSPLAGRLGKFAIQSTRKDPKLARESAEHPH
jgi:hypothetical protein